MHSRTFFHAATLLSIYLFSTAPVQAGIVITGTRIIYPVGEQEVTIKINNDGDKPVLVQSWIDEGDANASPETAKVPFTLTPPVSRINKGKGQMLRLIYTGSSLPTDRESLFWLNVLEIPAASKGNKHHLKMAFRSRLKIFYRPVGLAGNANEAGQSVTWKNVPGGVEGTNPTPYYVSMANVTGDKAGKTIIAKGGMIAPYGRIFFPEKKKLLVIYPSYIDDYGRIKQLSQSVI